LLSVGTEATDGCGSYQTVSFSYVIGTTEWFPLVSGCGWNTANLWNVLLWTCILIITRSSVGVSLQ